MTHDCAAGLISKQEAGKQRTQRACDVTWYLRHKLATSSQKLSCPKMSLFFNVALWNFFLSKITFLHHTYKFPHLNFFFSFVKREKKLSTLQELKVLSAL